MLLKRFSGLGIAAVIILLVSGTPLAWYYIHSFKGFIGTGYGNLLMVKIMMMCLALGFAWLNRQAVEKYFSTRSLYALTTRVPYYIEAETLILLTILFTAAGLTSQPPPSIYPSGCKLGRSTEYVSSADSALDIANSCRIVGR